MLYIDWGSSEFMACDFLQYFNIYCRRCVGL